MFIRDGTDLPRVLDNFRGSVSADEEPQILLRAYESWIDGEIRVLWADDQIVDIAAHPQSTAAIEPVGLEPALAQMKEAAQKLDAGLLTTDFARTVQGTWRLVEIGNGQVSQASGLFSDIARRAGLSDLFWAGRLIFE